MKLKLEYPEYVDKFEYALTMAVPSVGEPIPVENQYLTELTITREFMLALIESYENGEWTDEEYITIEWGPYMDIDDE